MDVQQIMQGKIAALSEKAQACQQEADRLSSLLPKLGKSAALVGDGVDGEFDIIEVGNSVYSKYGEVGIVVAFENIAADNWCDVTVIFEEPEGEKRRYRQKADRL